MSAERRLAVLLEVVASPLALLLEVVAVLLEIVPAPLEVVAAPLTELEVLAVLAGEESFLRFVSSD